MHFLRVIFLLLALVKRGLSASLATPFDGTSTYDGDKFTIITKDSAIVIERFDIHMKNVTATIRISTRTGCRNVTDGFSSTNPQPVYFVCGYPQDEYTDSNDGIASDWTTRFSGTLTGLGQNVPTPCLLSILTFQLILHWEYTSHRQQPMGIIFITHIGPVQILPLDCQLLCLRRTITLAFMRACQRSLT